MTLKSLTRDWEPMAYGFLDASAKREIRRKTLKAIAVPGCQMPYASREVPMARGWGTGGLQVIQHRARRPQLEPFEVFGGFDLLRRPDC